MDKSSKRILIETVDFRVWCEHCSIRIAPNEEQIVADAKPYHQRCYTKYVSAVPQRIERKKGYK